MMMITCQCDPLLEKFNVTPFDHWSCRTNLLTILGSLSLSVAFDYDWADNAIRDSELQSQAGAPVHVFSRFKKRWVERSAACPVEARTMFSADEIVSAQSGCLFRMIRFLILCVSFTTSIRMLYNINCFCMWERSLGGLVSEEPDDDEVDAELPDVTKTTEDLPKNLEMKYYEPNAETTEGKRKR
ncbi:hypothetical protein Bca4012_032250 [Brassica carinata]